MSATRTLRALFYCGLVGLTASVSAQTWTSQTLPTTESLRSVHFINANDGWAAGYGGVIYHTTDGGSNWSSQTTNITTRLLAIRFLNGNVGWANTGLKVLRTEDGGGTWNDMTGLDANAAIFRNVIFPVSSTVAWSTAQGSGQRWFYRYTATSATAVTEQTFGLITSGVQLIDLWFVDQDNGWAVGSSGQIWKISSASTESPSFTNQTNASITTATLSGVFFLDANTGWAVGTGGAIIHTTNGGSSWSALTSGTSTNLKDVHFLDADHGSVVGESGLIRVTTDGGATWSAQTSNVSTTLWSVVYLGANPGFIAGGDLSTSGNGTVLRTDDALPVQLTSFTAIAHRRTAELRWRTEAEVNSHGFQVERRRVPDHAASWQTIGFVPGAGTTNAPSEYTYADGNLAAGRYAYRIKLIDRDGSVAYSDAAELEIFAPSVFALEQNYPNPFNPSTVIRYAVHTRSLVRLSVFNLLGEAVGELVNSEQDAGYREVTWNPDVSAGIYFYRLEAISVEHPQLRFAETRRLLFVK